MWRKCCPWRACCPCIKRTYEAPEVQELDYRHGSLSEVPPEIFSYERTLEKLDLGSNQISDLPPNLFHCHELRELDLCDNDLKEIPAAVESLTRLAKLDVSRNALSEVPESIKNCKNLTYLDLSLNQLNKLPEAICQLVHLEELFLNETSLEFLPANFGRLTKLKNLELRENLLQTLPKSMSRLHQIQKLDIGSNDIEDLPEVIGTMTSLTELWADSNCIREIPKFIGNLTKLACMDLSKNDVREISPEIGKCTNLIDVTLTHNSFSIIPDSFTKLENLSTLRIDCNCVGQFPEDIGKLKNLQEMSAIGNMLTSLPLSIGLLRKLHTLYLDDNDIPELPIEIGSCTSLTVLSVAKNKLANVPSEVGHLSKLKMLNLTNNLIQNLPVSILGLSNLGALWLTHGQNKPLVALNREIDSSGQHVVTCCLLPQLPSPGIPIKKGESDEEVPRRSERKIRFQNEIEPPAPEKPALNGGLLRAPTPYPKELRALAKHASHIRQAKSQNGEVVNYSDEPMYEGDEDAMDNGAKENYELQPLQPLPLHETKDERMLGLLRDNHIDRKNKKHLPLVHETIKFQADKHSDEATMPNWIPKPDANPPLNTIGLPEVLHNNPAPSVEESPASGPSFSSVGRTPPPYHIAAKRAAFFRSSGGAGSGKINFSSDAQLATASNSDVINQNVPMQGVTTAQYSGSTEENDWNRGGGGHGVAQEPNYLRSSGRGMVDVRYDATTPSPTDNLTYNETNAVQQNDKEYGGVLSDNNANITSAKPSYSMGAGDGSNANAHLPPPPDQGFLDNQMQTLQQMERNRELPGPNANMRLGNNERRTGNSTESRIPVKGSNSIADFNLSNREQESKISRIPSFHGYTSPNNFGESGESLLPPPPVPEPHLPPPQSSSYTRSKSSKTGIPKHFESKGSHPAKGSMSTSKIPSKPATEMKPPAEPYKRTAASAGSLKYSSGLAKGSQSATNIPSQSQDIRKSGSRIPKFDTPRTVPEESSSPPRPADDGKMIATPSSSYTSIHSEKAASCGVSPKQSRSGIPKPGVGRTPSPTGSKLASSRKPWIFGTHKNARVVSVEHVKANHFELGFTIDDFAGQVPPPEGKGIYVVATDSEELPVKVGDKILQVDGIDVGQMGVEIVNKILGNCQENIQLLVSRQH